MIPLRFLSLGLLAAICLVPAAAAQTAPTTRLTLEGAPTSTQPIEEDFLVVPLNVVFQMQGVVCSGAATFSAALAATATPVSSANTTGNGTTNGTGNSSSAAPTFTVTLTPPSLNFNVGAGAYASGLPAGGQPYRGSQPFTATIAGRNVTELTAVKVHVDATLPAYTGMQCRGAMPIPAAATSSDFTLNFNASSAAPPTPSEKLPVPVGLVVVGLLAAVFATRRGRQA